MGKGLVVSSLALAAGFLLPVYAGATQLDTQQHIIAQKEQEQASNALNMICSIALVSL